MFSNAHKTSLHAIFSVSFKLNPRSQCEAAEKNLKLIDGSLKAICLTLQDETDVRIISHINDGLPFVLNLISNGVIKGSEKLMERAWMILYYYVKSLHITNVKAESLLKSILDPYFQYIGSFIEELFVKTKYECLIDVKRIAAHVL